MVSYKWIKGNNRNSMTLRYNDLWHCLIDRDMTKMQLRLVAGMSTGAFAKLSKGEALNTSTLEKLYKVLGCDIGEMVCYVLDKVDRQEATLMM